MSDALKYIGDEFETLRKMAIKGKRDASLEAVMKMVFIAGVSAALGFEGNDTDLSDAIKPAMQAISERYGGRTIFPITTNIEMRIVHLTKEPPPNGELWVGVTEPGDEVVINHPNLLTNAKGEGYIVFSPQQARDLAHSLLRQAAAAEQPK